MWFYVYFKLALVNKIFIMITISIISHLDAKKVEVLLKSLSLTNNYKKYIDKIIIVSNVPEKLDYKKNFDLKNIIEYLTNSTSKGFAENHNDVFKRFCDSEYFLVINPDIIFPKTFDFKYLIRDLLNKKNNAVISPRIYEKGKICYPRKFPNLYDYFFYKKNYTNNNFWISGCFMLFKSVFFKKINGFDSNFFMYMEDVDICKRLSDKNLKIIKCDEQYILHNAKRKSKKNLKFFYYHLKSLIYYFSKNS